MSLFRVFDLAASAMSAQSVRLNITASNLANADSISGSPDDSYRARHAIFQALGSQDNGVSTGVRVTDVVESQAPVLQRYEPGHPLADAAGYVYGSNVNTVEEMVNMISAARTYQNNVEVMSTSRDLLMQTLRIGQ